MAKGTTSAYLISLSQLRGLLKEYLLAFAGVAVVIIFIIACMERDSFSDYVHLRPWLMLGVVCGLSACSISVYYHILYVRIFLLKRYVLLGVSMILLTWLMAAIDALLFLPLYHEPGNGFFHLLMDGSIQRSLLFYLGISVLYTMLRANISLISQRRKLENARLTASLALLQQAAAPHFLFNTLNNIYATARAEKATATAACLEELAGLMRYTISDAGKEQVPVASELAFIEKYLHLQRIRLEQRDDLIITIQLDWDHQPAAIAPMLLLPFIENAFKYGISVQQPSSISVSITIQKGALVMEVVNTDHSAVITQPASGTGIATTTQRLELQYAGRYKLQQQSINGSFTTNLSLQL